MTIEILLRLPPKSLVRFNTVCKRWNFLISSNYFSRLHAVRRPTNPISGVFLRASSSNHYQFLSLSGAPYLSSQFSIPLPSSPPPTSSVRILQSCNGLFLCRSVSNGLTFGPPSYCIYNAATRFFNPLPRIKPFRVLGVTLAFQPDQSPDYHVICVGSVGLSDSDYRIVVYSSSTGCWKDWVEDDFRLSYEVVFGNGVFWNGAVHWIAAASRNESIYFDVENQRLGKMPSPPMTSRRGIGTFRECDGKLCYVDADFDFYKVYVMASYDGGWCLEYNVRIGGLEGLPKVVVENYAQWMLCLAREEGGGKLVMVVHVPGKILGYDLVDGSCKKLCDVLMGEGHGPGSLHFSGFDAHAFAPSLGFVS